MKGRLGVNLTVRIEKNAPSTLNNSPMYSPL